MRISICLILTLQLWGDDKSFANTPGSFPHGQKHKKNNKEKLVIKLHPIRYGSFCAYCEVTRTDVRPLGGLSATCELT